jgi:hypothetical protein
VCTVYMCAYEVEMIKQAVSFLATVSCTYSACVFCYTVLCYHHGGE